MDSLKNDDLSVFAAAVQLIKSKQTRRVYIGYSGGIDSHVLLHLCSQSDIDNLFAIHINHQLQAEADNWQRHCEQECQSLAIPLLTFTVDNRPKKGESIEAFARQARYQLISAQLTEGDLFISAHHCQDQAETFLLQLMRGAGLDGLKSMPEIKPLGKGLYLRPLLRVSKPAIRAYAKTHQLNYISDPSNDDLRFARNFVRAKVIPVLESRWSEACQSIATSAQWLQEIELEVPQQVAINELIALPQTQQKQLIRSYINGKINYRLSRTEIAYVLTHFLSAKPDKHPLLTLGEYELRRHQGQLLLTKKLATSELSVNTLNISQIQTSKVSQITPVNEYLSIVWQMGEGIDFTKYTDTDIEIRSVSGGMRFQPHGRSHSQTIKKLLQAQQIQPWLRQYCYGLFIDKELVAVLGLGVSQSHYHRGTNCYLPKWQIAPEFVSI